MNSLPRIVRQRQASNVSATRSFQFIQTYLPALHLEAPLELPDNTLVCQAHQEIICSKCRCNYTFLRAGMFFAASERFMPPTPTDTPKSLFVDCISDRYHGERFVRLAQPQQILIFTHGALKDQDSGPRVGGCAFVFRPQTRIVHDNGAPTGNFHTAVTLRLEDEGPSSTSKFTHTSNRAELRAVVAALQFRVWHSEGWKELVIATDSEYVVSGATDWVTRWQENGWVRFTSRKKGVQNKDLWQELLRTITTLEGGGLHVLFWLVPKERNEVAVESAMEATERPPETRFCTILGTDI